MHAVLERHSHSVSNHRSQDNLFPEKLRVFGINQDSKPNKAAHQIVEEALEVFKKGPIPLLLKEEFSMIEPSSEIGTQFQKEITNLLRSMKPDWDSEREPIQFVLCDRPHFNAFYADGAVPVIGFHKDCFCGAKRTTKDLIACVLGHECVHGLASKKYGQERTITKIEEASADIMPLELVANSGLNPAAAKHHFEDSAKQNMWPGKWETVSRVFDPHPTDATRIAGHDIALSKLYMQRGDIECEETDLNEKELIYNIAKSAEYTSTFKNYLAKNLKDRNDTEKLLDVIIKFINSAEFLLTRTGSDIAEALVRIAALGKKVSTNKIDILANALLDKAGEGWVEGCHLAFCGLSWLAQNPTPQETQNLQNALRFHTEKNHGYHDLLPLGRLKKIDEASKEFIEAGDKKSALLAAVKLNNAIESEPSLNASDRGQVFKAEDQTRENTQSDIGALLKLGMDDPYAVFFRSFLWNRFTLNVGDSWLSYSGAEIKNPLACPWDKHLAWANELGGNAESDVREALLVSGIVEPRTLAGQSSETEYKYSKGCFPVLGIGPRIIGNHAGKEVLIAEQSIFLLDDLNRIKWADKSRNGNCVQGHNNFSTRAAEAKVLAKTIDSILESGPLDKQTRNDVVQMIMRRDSLYSDNYSPSSHEFPRHITMPETSGMKAFYYDPELFLIANRLALKSKKGQNTFAKYLEERRKENPLELKKELKSLLIQVEKLEKERPGSQIRFLPIKNQSDSHLLIQATLGSKEGNSLTKRGFFESGLFKTILELDSSVISAEDKLRFLNSSINWQQIRHLLRDDRILKTISVSGFVNSTLQQLRPVVSEFLSGKIEKVSKWSELEMVLPPVEFKNLLANYVYLECFKLADRSLTFDRPDHQCMIKCLDLIPATFIASPHDAVLNAFQRAGQKLAFPLNLTGPELVQAINIWGKFHDTGIFRARLSYKLLQDLVLQIEKISEVETKAALYQGLLCRAQTRIAEPELREKIIAAWAKNIKELEGLDNGTEEYSKRILARLAAIKELVPAVDRQTIFNALASEILAQAKLSKDISATCGQISEKDLRAFAEGTVFAELGIDQLRYESSFRKELIQFLVSDVSPGRAEKIIKRSYEKANRRLNDFTTGVGSKDRMFMKRVKGSFEQKFEIEKTILFHKNYWHAPVEARIGIMRELLLPALPDPCKFDEQIAIDFALDIVFPEDRQNSEYIRTRIRRYIRRLPPYVIPYALSALVAAGKSDQSKSKDLGTAIAAMIESTGGPAEWKGGQAAQGHPRTDEKIRDALAHLKTRVAPPLRWQLTELISQCVPEEILKNIRSIGKILGAGSIYIAVEVDWRDDKSIESKKVLSVLRPHARHRGESGFNHLEMPFEDDPDNHPISSIIKEQIQAARRFLNVETTSKFAEEFGRIAKDTYNGLKVSIGERTLQFKPLNVICAAENCFVSDRVEGVPLVSLPHSTKKERTERRDYSLSVLSAEMMLLLNGKHSDSDRHGGNNHVSQNEVSPIDLWGLLYPVPSKEMHSKFAEIFASSMAKAYNANSFQTQFNSGLRAFSENSDEAKVYFSQVQKSFLALSEYFNNISRSDFFAALGVAISSSPDYVKEIFQKQLSQTWRGRYILRRLTKAPAGIGLKVEKIN